MTHPTDIPTFQAALGALTNPDLPSLEDEEASVALQAKIADAQATTSVVPQCGLVLDALKDHAATLGLNGSRVLAGAAHLVLTNGWLGRAGEADGIRDAARTRIAALEA